MLTNRGSPSPQIVVTSVGAERLVAAGQDPAGHVPLVPDGVCHAAALGEQRTLCGLGTERLSWFPGLPFRAAAFLRRCEACLRRVENVPA